MLDKFAKKLVCPNNLMENINFRYELFNYKQYIL